LDLDAGASVADVREAYRLQVRTWNPDYPGYNPRVRAATERRLAEVRQAYEWLKANGDAVVWQASGAGTQPTNMHRASTGISKRVTNGFFYLVLVGLLIYGIGVITTRNADAWFGPLVTLNANSGLPD
jgi:preprotein translocase subunit Sec63